MSGLPLHWVLYSTHVPTGPTNLDRALQVSPPGWAHSLEGGPNRLGVACGHFSRKFDVGLDISVSANVECVRYTVGIGPKCN